MKYLDLRGPTWDKILGESVARFQTKKEAASFAKEHGWLARDVTKAANRFCICWVISQMQSTETITLLTQSGGTAEFPHFGYW